MCSMNTLRSLFCASTTVRVILIAASATVFMSPSNLNTLLCVAPSFCFSYCCRCFSMSASNIFSSSSQRSPAVRLVIPHDCNCWLKHWHACRSVHDIWPDDLQSKSHRNTVNFCSFCACVCRMVFSSSLHRVSEHSVCTTKVLILTGWHGDSSHTKRCAACTRSKSRAAHITALQALR